MSGQAYVGTMKRTFKQALSHLLLTDYRLVGSRRVREMLADDVQRLAEQFFPAAKHLRPGWLVFVGTKAIGPKAHPGQEAGDHELVTLPWPVLLPEDIQRLATMPPGRPAKKIRQEWLKSRLVRLIEYGWRHAAGPVLLTQADLAAMLNLSTVQVSCLLRDARLETGKPLLTKGYFFDQGRRPTHKAQVIALYEGGVDEADIARRTHHAPPSVGRYIRDYERVKLLVRRHVHISEIAPLTGLQPSVVRANVALINQFCPNLFSEREPLAPSST